MSRSLGGTWLTTLPLIAISPPEMFSSPATMRSSVLLPQPEGPTSTVNEPSGISIDTPCSTAVSPKRLMTLRMLTLAMGFLVVRERGGVFEGSPAIARSRDASCMMT